MNEKTKEDTKEFDTEKNNDYDVNIINDVDIYVPGIKKIDYDTILTELQNESNETEKDDENDENDDSADSIDPMHWINSINLNELNIIKVDYMSIYSKLKSQSKEDKKNQKNNKYNTINKPGIKDTLNSILRIKILTVLLFSAYIILNTVNLVIYRTDIFDVENNVNINLFSFLAIYTAVFIGIFVVYTAVKHIFRINNFHKYILFFSAMAFSVGLVANNNLNIFFSVTVLVVLFYIIEYTFKNNIDNIYNIGTSGINEDDGIKLDALNKYIKFNHIVIAVSILAVAYVVVISYANILRYRAYYNSTFDFGIFAQMFENMAKTGRQVTSVERNMHMSHFAVHFSPIFYLFLPFYMLYREPQTILVIQSVMIAAGVFPLILIAKRFKFSNTNIFLAALAYLFYPSLTGGAFYDFHENKFLTVLILWLLYFIVCEDKKIQIFKVRLPVKWIFVYVFVLLTLMVKEDSFLYVFFVGLYVIFDKKSVVTRRAETPQITRTRQTRIQRLLQVSLQKFGLLIQGNIIHGLVICVLSLGYFLAVTHYLRLYGLGVMTYRYELFLTMFEDGFIAMIKNVIKNPALLLSSILSVPEKLDFILYMFVPLCFMPVVSKKLRFLVLLIPMIIMNLATSYIYQYDINFQYTYGVTALLFFAALKNLSEWGGDIDDNFEDNFESEGDIINRPQNNINYDYAYDETWAAENRITGNTEETENALKNTINTTNSTNSINSIKTAKSNRITVLFVTMACCSIILFMSNNFNKIHMYNFIWNNFKYDFIETDEILARIPIDASVTANTYMVPHLIKRENLYAANHDEFDYFYYDTEYLVNDIRQVDDEQYSEILKDINERGYKKVDAGIMVEVFRKESDRDNLLEYD